MAIQNILQKIEQEEKKEIQEIQEKTAEQVKQILKQAQAKAKVIKAKALADFKFEKQEQAKKILREQKKEFIASILIKKKEILDEIFQKALAKLKESNNEKLIIQLKKNLPTDGEIRENLDGGFIFVSKNLEINNTWPCLISEVREKLETKIAGILF